MSVFSLKDTRFFVVRHAEAQKNLDKMHGGGAQDLTIGGLIELKRSAMALLNTTIDKNRIVVYQREGRSKETARFLAEELIAPSLECKNIYGIGLGVIATLNEDELSICYPEVSKVLYDWKHGNAKLDNYPDIPGREHMSDFAIRIKNGLSEILKPNCDVVFVGTTSTINMINHLLVNNGCFERDSYDFVTFPFSGVNGWNLSTVNAPEKFYSNF